MRIIPNISNNSFPVSAFHKEWNEMPNSRYSHTEREKDGKREWVGYTNPAKVQIKWNKSWALVTIRKQIPMTRACVRLTVIWCIYIYIYIYLLLSAIEHFIFNAFECSYPIRSHITTQSDKKMCIERYTYRKRVKKSTRTIIYPWYWNTVGILMERIQLSNLFLPENHMKRWKNLILQPIPILHLFCNSISSIVTFFFLLLLFLLLLLLFYVIHVKTSISSLKIKRWKF